MLSPFFLGDSAGDTGDTDCRKAQDVPRTIQSDHSIAPRANMAPSLGAKCRPESRVDVLERLEFGAGRD